MSLSSHVKKFIRTLTVSAVISLSILSTAVHSGVAGLPDSAQPGVQRPETDTRSRVPDGETDDVVEIPAVIDRPLEVDEGDRILVQQFRLLNVEDLLDLEVFVSDVEALLEVQRQDKPEGFTIGHLQEVADKVTRYYRGKGLILAQAVIPVQDVDGGVVEIEVFIGHLDRILVEGNQVYDNRVLEQVFSELIGQPIVQEQIESALLRLADYPGLRVYGVFQPGQLVGSADLVLNVQEEDRFETALRTDNHGSQETGRLRGRIDMDWSSLFGGADSLGLIVQQTYNPKESFFYFIEYERYLPFGLRAGSSWSRSDYGVGGVFESQQIKGDSEDISIFLEKSFIRSRQKNLSTTLRMTRSQSEVTSLGIDQSQEVLSVLNVSLQYDAADTFNLLPFLNSGEDGFQMSGINFMSLELSQGLEGVFGAIGSSEDVSQMTIGEQPGRQGGSGEFVSGDFTKLFASFARYQSLTATQSVLFRSEFQWSDDLLLSQGQYSIGGPNSVRAFAPSFELADQAGFLSLEYIIDAPFFAQKEAFDNYNWGELLQFSIYYDVAVGKINDPTSFDEVGWKSYQGMGLGLQFNLPGKFASRFLCAWALGAGDEVDKGVGNGREPQFWINISYSF